LIPKKNRFKSGDLNGLTFNKCHNSPLNKLCGSMGRIISSEDLKFLTIRSETPRMESKKSSRGGKFGNNRDFGNILIEDLNNHIHNPMN